MPFFFFFGKRHFAAFPLCVQYGHTVRCVPVQDTQARTIWTHSRVHRLLREARLLIRREASAFKALLMPCHAPKSSKLPWRTHAAIPIILHKQCPKCHSNRLFTARNSSARAPRAKLIPTIHNYPHNSTEHTGTVPVQCLSSLLRRACLSNNFSYF